MIPPPYQVCLYPKSGEPRTVPIDGDRTAAAHLAMTLFCESADFDRIVVEERLGATRSYQPIMLFYPPVR